MDLLVRWEDEKPSKVSWVTEWDVQELWPDTLYAFWDGLGGRIAETGINEFFIFRILKHQKNYDTDTWEFLSQFLGFAKAKSLWLTESELREKHEAHELLQEYLDSIDGDLGPE